MKTPRNDQMSPQEDDLGEFELRWLIIKSPLSAYPRLRNAQVKARIAVSMVIEIPVSGAATMP